MAIKEIYAMSVGGGPVPTVNHFYFRPDMEPRTFSRHFFWVLKDENGDVTLVDTGYFPECLEELNLSQFTYDNKPEELLKRINIKPEDVKNVILTHLHWDHWCGEDIFPNADYYVHADEIVYVNGPLMRFRTYARHYNFKGVQKFLELLHSGRVHQLTGDRQTILPSIEGVRFGGHTPGLLGVVVDMEDGKRVITSDVAPRYGNVAEITPPGIHYDVTEALDALEAIKKEAENNLDHVIPCHDPDILKKPEIAPGVFKVA